MVEIRLIGKEGRRIVVFTKGLPCWQRGFDHGDVVGPEDEVEDLEDARRDEDGIFGRLLDESGEDTKSHLYVTARRAGAMPQQSAFKHFNTSDTITSIRSRPSPPRGLEADAPARPGHDNVPNAHSPDIAGRLLLQKGANLLNLGPPAGRVVEQIAQLAAVWLDVNCSLGGSRIALEHQDLMLRAAFLLYGVHRASDRAAVFFLFTLLHERARRDERGFERDRVMRGGFVICFSQSLLTFDGLQSRFEQ